MNTKFLVSSFIFSRPYYQTPVEIFRERPWNPYSFSCRSALTLSWDYWRWAQLWVSGANTNTPRLPWLYNWKFKVPGFREPEGLCACAATLWQDEDLHQSRTTKNWNFVVPYFLHFHPHCLPPALLKQLLLWSSLIKEKKSGKEVNEPDPTVFPSVFVDLSMCFHG